MQDITDPIDLALELKAVRWTETGQLMTEVTHRTLQALHRTTLTPDDDDLLMRLERHYSNVSHAFPDMSLAERGHLDRSLRAELVGIRKHYQGD